MKDRTKRIITAWILGIPSFGYVLLAIGFLADGGRIQQSDLFILTFISAECGLSYRAFETRDDFQSSPWIAYFFSYQIRLLVASVLLGATAILLAHVFKEPLSIALCISGPLAFLFASDRSRCLLS